MKENFVILIPSIDVMTHEVEQFIYRKTGSKIKILFNDPYKVHLHIEMLKDAYKIIKKDEGK